ncbi:MAG: hypothetical protein WCQ49_03525 [Candidatus Saccharibacteria bacterium]
MENEKLFIGNPVIMDSVMSFALDSGIGLAESMGAKFGTLVITIVLNGKQYLQAATVYGDIFTDYSRVVTYDDAPGIVGINYPGYAAGKAYQSIRTGKPSKEGSALGFGESDSEGSYCSSWYYEVEGENRTFGFFLTTSFSGLKPEQDYVIAKSAAENAIDQLKEFLYSDGKRFYLAPRIQK